MFKRFDELFPELAARESRWVCVESDGTEGDILAGKYLFLESYCVDADCDCQRVLLSVVEESRGIVASISYGFNPAIRFPMNLDPSNPFLDPLNPQSPYAEDILSLFKEIALDDVYEDRLKRHYGMVKALYAPTASSSGQLKGAETPRRGESARQRRKQQKAARRGNLQQ